LHSKGIVISALMLFCADDQRVWLGELVPRLRLFAKMLTSALSYRDSERDAQHAARETAQFRERLVHLARIEAVGAMTAAVAHEVNQPLMAIENYAHAGRLRLAVAGPVDRAKLDELLGKISSHAALAGEVLDRLRAMVKRRESQEIEFDPAQLLGNASKLIEMQSRLKDIRVETAIAPDLPRGLGDEIQIQQVILNLAWYPERRLYFLRTQRLDIDACGLREVVNRKNVVAAVAENLGEDPWHLGCAKLRLWRGNAFGAPLVSDDGSHRRHGEVPQRDAIDAKQGRDRAQRPDHLGIEIAFGRPH
jgi:hypothetical protein